MGSYLFANQYQNEVIPDEEKRFKKEWLKYTTEWPKTYHRFAFIDPAIGQKDHNDYTGIVVVDADPDGNWYLRVANRYRLTPTQCVDKMFQLAEQGCMGIGVEVVAYQEALLYLVSEEMRRRKKPIPVKGIKRASISKETRILGLVPRFEWGKIFIAPGMVDFEDEYETFPRGAHDDLLDSLASLEELVFYPPQFKEKPIERPHSPHDPNYERWYRQQLAQGKSTQSQRSDDED